ncbi:hypothetical protein BFL43_18820 [Williamsia sp. 1135]|nr:hypothetical protein BFL43_18820 [Williamsia sp. 1135]
MDVRVDALGSALRSDLGDHALWFRPRRYPNSLALSIIDAIFSTGARYATVENILDRYIAYRDGQGGDATGDGAPELLATFAEVGSSGAWAHDIGNRRPTSTTPGAPLKAEAVIDAATRLLAAGIATSEDLRTAADSDALHVVWSVWREVPGQRSGFTWAYLQLLVGISALQVDGVVAAYLARVLDVSVDDVDAGLVSELIAEVARSNEWDERDIPMAIWRAEQRARSSGSR